MLKVKFWGATGSIPSRLSHAQLKEKIIYAMLKASEANISTVKEAEELFETFPIAKKHALLGNTACIEIQGLDDYYILDAGSGLRNLGIDIFKRDNSSQTVHLFLSHFHWDHINGFPFFGPAFNPNFNINIYSSHPNSEERLRYQQIVQHFPVSIDDMGAAKKFVEISQEEGLMVGSVKVQTLALRHPGGSYSYRLDFENGKSLIYATDGEYPTKELSRDKLNTYVNFFKDADILIFDSQYSFPDSEITKADWGHSSPNIGVELAMEARVKHLVLFHHEPAGNDEDLERVLLSSREYRDIYAKSYKITSHMKIDLAVEGGVIVLED